MTIKITGDSSASTPAFAGNDGDSGLHATADQVQLVTNGTVGVTVDSSQDVGVGTASPFDSAAGRGNVSINGSSSALLALGVADSQTMALYHGGTNCELNNIANGVLDFKTNNQPRVRIDSSGDIGIDTTAPYGGSVANRRHVTVNGTNDFKIQWGTGGTERGYLYGDATNLSLINTQNGYLRLNTNNTERMRITNAGFTKFTNSGPTYTGTTASYYEFNSDVNTWNTIFASSNTSLTSSVVTANAHRTQSSAYSLFRGYSGNFNDVQFNLAGDGNAYADLSWNNNGADYAEYFEWSDGNTAAEDRRGISVVLAGDKIREAVAGEEPIGVISANPSVVGDAAWNKWNGKYLRDDFGTYIQEDYEVEDEDGNTVTQQRRKLNPDYNPDIEYISRENRPEWDTVGLMGKLRIRKGQVTGSRWIKMRDISDTVEEWLVR